MTAARAKEMIQTLQQQVESYRRDWYETTKALEQSMTETATLRSELSRAEMKVEQYRKQLDDRWVGVVALVNSATEQAAVLRAALDRRDALLRDIAADNDPQDGCAYADLARAVLADERKETL